MRGHSIYATMRPSRFLVPSRTWLTAAAILLGSACCDAAQQARERLDRGLVALPTARGQVYVGWRLLDSDAPGTAFNVYRRGSGEAVKLNAQPIDKTTDFLDGAATDGAAYFVRPVVKGDEGAASPEVMVAPTVQGQSQGYLSLKLDGKHKFQKVGIADLDGDGRYDFVLKQPEGNIDPYEKYWQPSPDTYKLEAYRHDGRFLWRYDLGWAIERGIWYSPYLVYDLDGDGKAEVAVKTGQGDPRDADGRVQKGPEHLTILDGLTGKPRAQVDWPSRDAFTGPSAYNYASRNQLCVAYLDGKRPYLLVERGTYNIITLVAYEFREGQLREAWQWCNKNEPRGYWGQGAHWMHVADVDADGRDEVLVGSAMLDDDGKALWTTGLGHPDHSYLGDIDPDRPGLEIYYGIEPRAKRNTMCLVDARTGKILWGHDQPTQHIHSSGLVSDIDASRPGAECYSGERDFEDQRWLRDSRENVISHEDLGGLAPRAAYWDADCQRELVRGSRIVKYRGATLEPRIEGSVVAVADILGDWREEILTSVAGELRIYSTRIPAVDRRTCLMQDPIYRTDVLSASMGYLQVPMTGYDLESSRKKHR
ncbi:MAG: rhamnogalacturonan lyase family protein [Pirellulales bacterium]